MNAHNPFGPSADHLATLEEPDDESATHAEADQANAPLLHDPFGRCKPGVVADFSREDRVRLLGEFSEAVLAGVEPSKGSMMFVAAGIASWLTIGGGLTRDFWKVSGPQGCTVTEAILWRRMRDGAGASSKRQQDGAVPSKLDSLNQNQDGTK
jgi:hypothetical protein